MKKLLLSAVMLLAAAATVSAQQPHSEGRKWWVGGSIGYSTTEEDRYSSRMEEFHFLPEVGYHISDRWAVGLQLGYTHMKNNPNTDDPFPAIDGFEIAPFARYTYQRWRGVQLFVDGGFSYGAAGGLVDTYEDYPYLRDGTVNKFALRFSPGISMCLSHHCSLVGRVNLFDVSYMKASLKNRYVTDIEYIEEAFDTWHVGLNNPFSVGGFMVGFNVTF